MSDTYTQLYIQLVFTVKGRNNFIQFVWEEELYKYITAVVQNDKDKMLAINGMPDQAGRAKLKLSASCTGVCSPVGD